MFQGPATTEALIAALDSTFIGVGSRQRELLALIARCDEPAIWESQGCECMAQWVASRFGISWYLSRKWIKAGHALEDLPLLAKALSEGHLPFEKVIELCVFATAQTEKQLIKWAKKMTLGTVRGRAKTFNAAPVDEARQIQSERSLTHWFDLDRKTINIFGRFAPADGQAIVDAIERLAAKVPDDPDLVDAWKAARFEARCADALWMMASRELAEDPDLDRATVTMFADLHLLLGDDHGLELEGGGLIHAETARRLACDCRLEIVLRGKDGHPVGIGRTSRNVPLWLERQVRFRDKTCTFPGCEKKHFTASHHVVWWGWPHEGPTDLENLTTVCGFHHKLVHEGGWKIAMGPGGVATWLRPDGTPYEGSLEQQLEPTRD